MVNTEELEQTIETKKNAIKHFKKHLKRFKNKEIIPPKNLVTDEQKADWFNTQIFALKNKIELEKQDLEIYKEMLKNAGEK